jgi:hypothetical protein
MGNDIEGQKHTFLTLLGWRTSKNLWMMPPLTASVDMLAEFYNFIQYKTKIAFLSDIDEAYDFVMKFNGK